MQVDNFTEIELPHTHLNTPLPPTPNHVQADSFTEIEVMKELNHPNVVKLYEVWTRPSGYRPSHRVW